jgi:hypothetical protein
MNTECNKTKEELIFNAALEIYKSKGYFSEKTLTDSVKEAHKLYELCFAEKEQEENTLNKIKTILKD